MCIQHLWGGGGGGGRSACRVPTPLQGDLIETLPQVRRKRDESRFNWRAPPPPRFESNAPRQPAAPPPTPTPTTRPLQMSCPLQPEGGSRSPHHSLGVGGLSDLGDGPPACSLPPPPPCPLPPCTLPPTPTRIYFAETFFLFCSIFQNLSIPPPPVSPAEIYRGVARLSCPSPSPALRPGVSIPPPHLLHLLSPSSGR